MTTKKKPTKARSARTTKTTKAAAATQAVLVQLEPNVIARLKRFQSKFNREYGVNLKNGPAVKMLLVKGLSVYETAGSQMDLEDAIVKKAKNK